MRKPSFTSIPINELIKPVSRRLEGHKKVNMEEIMFFKHLNIWKTKKEGAN
jgi:hypothetical protein